MFKRSLLIPEKPERSFFLWGPRQTGKSTLLKERYPSALRIDLLRTSEFLRYTQNPGFLREEITAAKKLPSLILIDEVQKVPLLLDEVHAMIEDLGQKFVLCGSSARKLRRGHANLLGGRATRYELFGLVSPEIGNKFDLNRALNHGNLPSHYLADQPKLLIRSYIEDYLKEEIAAEGLVRNLPAFSNFLSASVLSDSEVINFSTIARDCGISSPTIKEYFQILVDTMLGSFLPSYTKRPKRKVIQAPKFYFSNVAVVNDLAKRGPLVPGSELFGKAFENWICHELKSYSAYSQNFHELSYWRLTTDVEVDFIVDQMEYAIEVKASSKLKSDHLRGLREIVKDHPKIKSRICVCLEPKKRKTDDGILIYPYRDFLNKLWMEGFKAFQI